MNTYQQGPDGYVRSVSIPDGSDFPKDIIDDLLDSAADWAAHENVVPRAFNNWHHLDDDFYAIVSASMIEGLLARALRDNLYVRDQSAEPSQALEKYIDKLNAGGGTGLIELAFACSLVSKHEKKTLDALYAIRNSYAHVARNLGLSVPELLNSLAASRQSQITDWLYAEIREFSDRKILVSEAMTRWLFRTAPLFLIKKLSNKIKGLQEN